MRWHYCRYCDRIQRFRSKCSSCNKRCEEVDVPRHSAQTATPLLAIPVFIVGIVVFLSRSFIHGFVDESDVCCTVIMLLYFMLMVSLITFSIFNYFRYRKWTKDVAREMVEEGVVVREGKREPEDREEAYASLGHDLRHKMPDERTALSDNAVVERVPHGVYEADVLEEDNHYEAPKQRKRRRPPRREARERPPQRRKERGTGRRRRRRSRYDDEEDNGDLDDEWLY